MGRDLRVRRGASAGALWEMTDGQPGPGLGVLVRSYCGYAERSPRPVTRREFAATDVVLIVGFGEPVLVADASGSHRLAAFVAGPGEGVRRVEHAGSQDGVEVRLPPWAAHPLLGVPAGELADRVVDLADLLGPNGRDLGGRLAAAPDWPARFALLDQVLTRAADRGPRPDLDLAHAWDRLARRHGDLPIAALLADTGWHRRGLADRFRTQTGLTPKAAARVMRLSRARELLTGPGTLADVALACGYYDQAHLHRDFRALAGCTPTEYRAAQLGDLLGTGP